MQGYWDKGINIAGILSVHWQIILMKGVVTSNATSKSW